MGAKRKSYTPQHRVDAARLVIDSGRTIAQVSREIGVGERALPPALGHGV
ncbi:transposase [Arsenicicoccus dermatophilus]|nr:transposase [Arsenicicoccus dermatophilus]